MFGRIVPFCPVCAPGRPFPLPEPFVTGNPGASGSGTGGATFVPCSLSWVC